MTNEMSNVPELRFPEFNEEWEDNNLKDITTLLKDGTHGTHKDVENGPWLLSAKNIKNNTINISDEDRKISITDYNKIYKNYTLEREDILLSIVGTIGRVSMVKDPVNIAFQRSVAIIRFSKPLESKFFLYLFGTKEFKKKLYRNQVVSAQPGIYLGDLAKFNIIYPLIIEEQQKIGNFFSKLDRQIELEEQKLSLLQEQKKGYMQKIFSQKLRFKDENGNEYSKWEEVKLQNIANIKKGEQIKKENIDNNGKYYHLNGGTTASNRTNLFNTNPFTISISEGGNSCGFIKMNKEYFFSGGHNYTLLDLSVSNFYLYAYLKYHEKKIMSLRVGSGLPNIQKKDISNYLIKIPSKEEQEKIGIFFLKFDELIDTQRKKIEVLKKQKNGFLQKMFV